MIGQGQITREFERAMGNWVDVDDGVAVGSGSAAVLLALTALQIVKGDEVILPSYVCQSVLEAVRSTGATPVLCDIGHDWLITPENIGGLISRQTKCIIVPHVYGFFADVLAFRKFGLPIIEDCAQAVSAKKTWTICGDIAIFSFHPTKCLTTGEGGMAVSPSVDLVHAMRVIRDGSQNASRGRLFSPMSDISAALGLAQLAHYEEALDKRRVIAARYRSALSEVIPQCLPEPMSRKTMYFRFPIKIAGGLDYYRNLFDEKNVCVRRGVDKLLHRFMELSDTRFPVSVRLFETTLSLPIYPALTDEELNRSIDAAVEIFSKHHPKSQLQ